MLTEITVTNPSKITEGTDEQLLANLEHIELENPETLSTKMELVREKNRTAISTTIAPGVRLMTQTKTVGEFNDYLKDWYIEVIEFDFAMKP